MDLMEYRAREMFAQSNIPVQNFVCTDDSKSASEKAKNAGLSYPLVVKAQVMTGGRGKAGGIRFAENGIELKAACDSILGMDIKGHTVKKVMLTPKADIAKEVYLSVMLDRNSKCPVIIFSPLGGMDIEKTAKESPDMIYRIIVDPDIGVKQYMASYLIDKTELKSYINAKEMFSVLSRLYSCFVTNDCLLCEINPLAVCKGAEGYSLLAIDGKVSVDDSAIPRHSELSDYASSIEKHPLTKEAEGFNFLYIPCSSDLTSNVAVMSNGSGMLMSCIDVITKAGMSVRSVLDMGGGATAQRIKEAVRIILSDSGTKILFINIFGGITRCDEVALGIKAASDEGFLPSEKPVIIRFEGTNKSKGLEIIRQIPGAIYADSLLEGVGELSTVLSSGNLGSGV